MPKKTPAVKLLKQRLTEPEPKPPKAKAPKPPSLIVRVSVQCGKPTDIVAALAHAAAFVTDQCQDLASLRRFEAPVAGFHGPVGRITIEQEVKS